MKHLSPDTTGSRFRLRYHLPLLGLIGALAISTAAGTEVIVDNPVATLAGTWTAGTTVAGYYGANYLVDDGSGSGNCTARFTPNLPSAGSYEVFARWTAYPNRGSNVPVTLVTAEGIKITEVNERANGSAWVSLGVYEFNAGTAGSVFLTNIGVNGYVIADAVRFLSVSNGVTLDDPSAVKIGTWGLSTTTPGYYGTGYLTDGNTGTTALKTATYFPNLPATSTYQVYGRWISNSFVAPKVQMKVVTPAGTAGVYVNQQADGGKWVNLGSYKYTIGSSGNLMITNTNATASVVADAVKFVPGTQQAGLGRFFAADTFWNRGVTTEALNADQSDATKMLNLVNQYGTMFNTTQYTEPVYIASASETTITVQNRDYSYITYANVPWPANATASAGTDANVVIYQPEKGKLWEFWAVSGTYPNITCKAGGPVAGASNVMNWSGINPAGWGVSASGLCVMGGLITMEEARRIVCDPNYRIPHAIALALPETPASHVAPANRHDYAYNGGTNEIPEGRRFRLPPTYDPAASMPTASALTKAIAYAARDYGMVVRDNTGHSDVVICGEDPRTTSVNPWSTELYKNQPSYSVLNSFPWNLLQVLPTTTY